jgi:hypothetical protein
MNIAQRKHRLNGDKSASERLGRAAAHVSTKKPSPQHMAVLLPVWPPPPSMRNSVVGLTCAPRRRRWLGRARAPGGLLHPNLVPCAASGWPTRGPPWPAR